MAVAREQPRQSRRQVRRPNPDAGSMPGSAKTPIPISLLVVQADLLRPAKTLRRCRKTLSQAARPERSRRHSRAVVINNLAFLAALAGKSTAADIDPLKLVAEAVEILAPVPTSSIRAPSFSSSSENTNRRENKDSELQRSHCRSRALSHRQPHRLEVFSPGPGPSRRERKPRRRRSLGKSRRPRPDPRIAQSHGIRSSMRRSKPRSRRSAAPRSPSPIPSARRAENESCNVWTYSPRLGSNLRFILLRRLQKIATSARQFSPGYNRAAELTPGSSHNHEPPHISPPV